MKEDVRVGDYATIAISETTVTHVARYDSFPKAGTGESAVFQMFSLGRGIGEEVGQRLQLSSLSRLKLLDMAVELSIWGNSHRFQISDRIFKFSFSSIRSCHVVKSTVNYYFDWPSRRQYSFRY